MVDLVSAAATARFGTSYHLHNVYGVSNPEFIISMYRVVVFLLGHLIHLMYLHTRRTKVFYTQNYMPGFSIYLNDCCLHKVSYLLLSDYKEGIGI